MQSIKCWFAKEPAVIIGGSFSILAVALQGVDGSLPVSQMMAGMAPLIAAFPIRQSVYSPNSVEILEDKHVAEVHEAVSDTLTAIDDLNEGDADA